MTRFVDTLLLFRVLPEKGYIMKKLSNSKRTGELS